MTKITGNHTFKGGVSVERSGMKDQIQLSAASAPATTNQNGSFRFTDATRTDGTGNATANVLLGLFDDYTEFGTKPLTNFIGMGYDFYAQDSWKATRKLTLELGLRLSLWQQWRDENNAIASFQSEFYDPAAAVAIDRANGSIVPGAGDPFNGIVLPGDSASSEALRLFPQLAAWAGCITDCLPASQTTRRTVCSRGSGWPSRSTRGGRSAAESAASSTVRRSTPARPTGSIRRFPRWPRSSTAMWTRPGAPHGAASRW